MTRHAARQSASASTRARLRRTGQALAATLLAGLALFSAAKALAADAAEQMPAGSRVDARMFLAEGGDIAACGRIERVGKIRIDRDAR